MADANNVKFPAQPTSDAMLDRLDTARLQWFHVKAVLVSGVGFFTDAYDLFTVSVIKVMIAFAHFNRKDPAHPKYGSLENSADLGVTGTALVGTLMGQVFFSVVGDRSGRKKAYGWTLWLMIFATIMCSATTLGENATFIGLFCMWRFILGIGIGGDYPLSATITSEYASRRNRGMLLAAVFSMQGIGIITASIVALIVTRAYRDRIVDECVINVNCEPLNYAWRICVGLGAVPAMATWYLRTQLPETPRFTLQVEQDVDRAVNNTNQVFANTNKFSEKPTAAATTDTRITFASFHKWVTQPKAFMVLFGTASTWFLLDVAFYSQNLFIPNVLSDIGYSPAVDAAHGTGQDIYNKVFATAAGNAIVAMIGTVPGYWFAVAFIEKMGRKPMAYMGFGMMTVLLVIMSIAYTELRANAIWAFIIMYALMFFFANFGPNTTTFVVPAECFPTRFRSTCHGISAACGKAGAVVGAFGFGTLQLQRGTQFTLGILSIFMFAGAVCTYFVPETAGKSLEELSDELDPPTAPEVKVPTAV